MSVVYEQFPCRFEISFLLVLGIVYSLNPVNRVMKRRLLPFNYRKYEWGTNDDDRRLGPHVTPCVRLLTRGNQSVSKKNKERTLFCKHVNYRLGEDFNFNKSDGMIVVKRILVGGSMGYANFGMGMKGVVRFVKTWIVN